MRPTVLVLGCVTLFAVGVTAAQAPPPQTPPQNPAAQAPAGQRGGGGGGRGRGALAVMTLTTSAWIDGSAVPDRFAQSGDEVSPPLVWSGAPDTTESFALMMHDINAAAGDGTSDVLHWLVWNIPKTAKGLPEAVPQGAQLADGSKQISMTGPYYRGPAAPASGPAHHYVFELFALDAVLDVRLPATATVVETRAAVTAAMATHVRGKAVLMGTFKYAEIK